MRLSFIKEEASILSPFFIKDAVLTAPNFLIFRDYSYAS